MKCLILIIAALLLIASGSGLLLSKTVASNEVNETNKASKATMELSEETKLEQRLADVL